ncbi:MAG: N-acetylglucosamine-6-phosphate deacetylase [Bacteroidetes bacterium]|nr:MAG: N-acetylglucosamine-6-phosphate deacetylase [Bacteroidota bacterium]
MKTLIIFCLSWILFYLPALGSEKDTTTVNGLFYLDGEQISISILNGKIVKLEPLSSGAETPVVYLAPGFIDLQTNGYSGVDFSDQNLTLEQMRKATMALWKVGVTTFLPTVITNDHKSLLKSFSLLADIIDDEEIGMSIPGFHLEGPYISPVQGYRGAHLEKYIRVPDWDEFLELQKAAHNRIRLITLAPEVKGAISFIRKCTESGVVVSLGHHNGSSEIIKQAVDAGASMSTHLGNGCANMINRHDNPIWPQLADDRITATIIADGFHLNKEEVQCFYKIKSVERIILISDALDLAGLPPGEYTRGERVVLLTPDVVKYPAENVLAGAASPITAGVSDMMKFTHCSLGNAVQMASTNPARALGLKDIGELKQGKRADLILFTIEDDKIVIQKTIIAGKVVYSKY